MLLIPLHLGAHALNDLGQAGINRRIGQSFAPQHCSQNADIRVPVDGHAFNACFHAEHLAHCIAKRKVMDSIAAVQQCSINVKEVGCSRSPVKTRTNEGAPRTFRHVVRSWIGMLRGGESHSRFDSEMHARAAADYRTAFFSSVSGLSLPTGRRPPSRNGRTSSLSSAMVRLKVLRCMPSSRAALHWFPLFCCNTFMMNRFLNSRTASE